MLRDGVHGTGDPYTTVTEPAFVARFLLDPDTDTVANVDALVDLPNGSTWALTIFTVDEVGRLLARWKETGEVANGSYFWAADQLIVPEPGVSAMAAAIRELVCNGDITSVGVRCEGQDRDTSAATGGDPSAVASSPICGRRAHLVPRRSVAVARRVATG
ncbi:hypothetical protein [Plantactinospora sp. CA-290183]|uniref:hypothetical protein n=1 Tax=Plantactinospora sp. CA-290183 TaxID=3240006 RepID=UPI003D89DB5C